MPVIKYTAYKKVIKKKKSIGKIGKGKVGGAGLVMQESLNPF